MLVGFVYLAVAPWIEIKVHSGQAKISLFVCWTILLPDKKCVKVISVQEAFVKGFAVHLSEFEISQTTWKNKTKNIKMLDVLIKNWKLRVWCKVSLLGVDSLWGECTFIPVDWGS